MNILISILMVGIMVACLNTYIARNISHFLNNLFKLPHPGPNDIQGSCSCRKNEGPDKYTFKDFLNQDIRFSNKIK